MSFAIHPFLWSSNSFDGSSSVFAGETIASGVSAVFTDCFFSGSTAKTLTTSASHVNDRILSPYFHAFFDVDLLTISRTQARAQHKWQRLALKYEVLMTDMATI